MKRLQTVKNKQGEVDFRKKLILQFTKKAAISEGHPTPNEYLKIIKERVARARIDFKNLQKRGIRLSPYLEIGAEVGHRSLVLENEFLACGFTSDISSDSLEASNHFRSLLAYQKMPLAICCDAYNLPFASDSLPFIFCYQTLHHFPDPLPILEEIKRVLVPGGYFFFSEEPVSQILNLNLWRRDFHLTWYEKLLKNLVILHFISKIGKSEVKHDILEEDFNLPTWQKALDIFSKAEATIHVFPYGPTTIISKKCKSAWLKPPFFKRILLHLLGGDLKALCQKEGELKLSQKPISLLNYLACPNCPSKPKLVIRTDGIILRCSNCHTEYRQKNGVYLLLSKNTLKNLYA